LATAAQEDARSALTLLLVAAGQSAGGLSYVSRIVSCDGDDRLLEFTFLGRKGNEQSQRAWLRSDGRLQRTEEDVEALRVAMLEEDERIVTTRAADEAWKASPEYAAAYEAWRAKTGEDGG